MPDTLNLRIAARLDEVAQLLTEQGANRFRAEAYARAADTVRGLPRSVREILDAEGLPGLERLPAIGESLARSIRAMAFTGRLPMLDRLRGEADPEALLASVPGVGRRFAERLHRDLGLHTLEDMEQAAHDGRLAAVPGFGAKRLAGVRDALAMRLGRVRWPLPPGAEPPGVPDLLAVDAEYRRKAAAGTLRRIAPRRFNPAGRAWLPVLHTERGGREYTALFSNTARAHALGRTRDWVVLYVDGARAEHQYTVITARQGVLKGKRVVRGREPECGRYYATAAARGSARRRPPAATAGQRGGVP